MLIIISGPPGSGKSSVAKILANKLSLEYVSAGMIFRNLAKEKGVSLIELNKMAENDFGIDKTVDMEIFNLINKKRELVIESHIAGWLFHSYADLNVYLTASLITRAKRIANRDGISFNDALEQIIKREESHRERFLKYYGIDLYDLSVFDLTINTEYLSPSSVANVILEYLKGKQIQLTHSS